MVVTARCRRCDIPLVGTSLEDFGDVVVAHEQNQHTEQQAPPPPPDPPHVESVHVTETESVRVVPEWEVPEPWPSTEEAG